MENINNCKRIESLSSQIRIRIIRKWKTKTDVKKKTRTKNNSTT